MSSETKLALAIISMDIMYLLLMPLISIEVSVFFFSVLMLVVSYITLLPGVHVTQRQDPQ